MSLQHVAKHLASKGRGEDKVLVHMTPGEVKGLQSLAMAHGGSLTINPHTGLAEAGFLSRLLPMIAGAGLTFFSGGALGPLAAAALVGGGTALAKGDLKAGLMAGLSAYGGAGLAGGAATMGAEAAGEAAGADALGTTPGVMATEGGSQAALTTNPAVNPQGFDAFGNTPSTTIQGGYDPSTSGSYIDPAKGQAYSAEYAKAAQPSFANAQTGIQQAYNDPSKYVDLTGGGMQTAQYGISALAPIVSPDRQPLPEEESYDGPLSKYKFDPNQYSSADRSQPDPYYKARMYNYAGGGPVEQMSNANAIGQNTGYPMADINKAAYSTPYQTPVSENVVTGSTDTGVDSMTGEQTRFAAGGNVSNNHMEAIDSYIDQANSGDRQTVLSKAKAGDYNAMIALNKLSGTPNQNYAQGGMAYAQGGISSLGGYSDGGRMLKGPGDGMSDNIPAQIGSKQPARLADGEFVVPADVVSHLGNGSTDAGARQLYKMMGKIRSARTGRKSQGKQIDPNKFTPA